MSQNINQIKKAHSQYFNKSIHDLYMRKGASVNKLEGDGANPSVFKMNTNESEKPAEHPDEDFYDLDVNLNDYDTYKLIYDFYTFLQNKKTGEEQKTGDYEFLNRQVNKLLVTYKTNTNRHQILATSYLELLSSDTSEVFEEKQCRIQVRAVKKAKLNESWEKEKNEEN